MDITFCGGAREVGGSCYLLKIDDKNILLDCGIRMKGSDNLPDLHLIQEVGGVDVIILSHAHLDHSGALPIISREYPEARIYMTHASKALLRVLLYDSLKLMESAEADIPIYSEKNVVEMLDRVICYSPQYSFKLLPGSDIKVSFYNAGHIAGAVLIYIQAREGTVLYTGDFSATDQKTVVGCSVPRLRPDLMISESTYGDKLHSNRMIEEERLIETVKGVIERKGKILIPAFALGRAQEIILILRSAINKKKLPEFKIYIDGMVRAINRIYRLNPNYLKSNLAKKIFKGNDIFYSENIIEVKDKEMREEIIKDKDPLCIISSSGMLKGGPSSYYAEELLNDEKNFIAITGYQDEEAPGRDILELLEEEEEDREITLNNKHLTVDCKLGKYGLSAHADKGEILGLMNRVSPRKVFLVHGNELVIEELALGLNQDIRGDIYVPVNGEKYSIDFKNPRKQLDYSKDIKPLATGEELNEENIERLWRYIYKKNGTELAYSVEEIIYLQEGIENISEEKVSRYMELLNESKYFTPNRRRFFLYHPVVEEELVEDDGIMEMNEMFALVDELFPVETGLYKRGARIEENTILMNFNFPAIAKAQYSGKLKELEERTGWQVEVNEECNQIALEGMIYKLVPPEIDIKKISYYRPEGRCELRVEKEPEDVEGLRARFYEKTGIQLIINTPEGVTGNEQEDELSLHVVDSSRMMEQNQAFNYIDLSFKELEARIYKKSRKVYNGIPYLELYFITPEVGERYIDAVKRLEEDTGWNIKIARTPNQNEVIKLLRRMMASYGIELAKNPGLYTDKALASVEISRELSADIATEIKEKFKEKTAYDLEFNIK